MGKVVCRWMVFGVIAGDVVGAFIPIESELALRFLAPEPVEAEAEHLDASCDASVIRELDCGGVVCLDRRRWLRPAHLDEGIMEWYHFVCSDKECS